MMKSALEIGQYFIEKSDLSNSWEGNTKLQKLLFFAWLIHYYKFQKSLFDDDFFAFENGPVVENVRKMYKINYFDLKNKPLPEYSIEEEETLILAIEIFGDSDCDELIELSHKSPIWEKYFKNSIKTDSTENTIYYCTGISKIPREELREELRMIENILYTYEYQKTAELNIKEEKLKNTRMDSNNFPDFLDKFTIENCNLEIVKPIPISVTNEDGTYVIDVDVFDLFSYDEDFAKARQDMEEKICILWKNFVEYDEKQLDVGGVFMKKLLLNYVGKKHGL
ncbi:hypothetical protein MmiAt1_13430 [Methanimicrococcus sp. At1]|uniref:Antitoxin SocA-like Panacea domain-containing protein n=1 Tax=Methanimicrococcus hacksteinii TaxID=3028293 RepID=A0ABU3VR16_9EURY|nr:Panacea domain-containing protein [Methanimicrococcus sp. At1]MDV0445749.1 hypothetical protein [Methanimicrococcus sp. At1]